jgi:transketolase N-terminal domain/subunit
MTDLRRQHVGQFLQASLNILTTCQENKDITRILLGDGENWEGEFWKNSPVN